MYGIFVEGRRPRSKKEVREAVANNPASVDLEATSMFGDETSRNVCTLPLHSRITFVGPDPYTKRSFFGNIERTSNGDFKVT